MFDHGPGGGEPGQVAGLGQDRGGPDRGQPVDAAWPARSAPARPGRRPSGSRCRPAWSWRGPSPSITQAIRSNAAGRCARTPAGSVRAANRRRTIRRQGRCPPRRVTSLRTARSNRAGPEAAGAVQVPAVTVDDHGQGGDPGGGAERPVRGLQGGGPHALEQVADLLDARHVLLDQLLAAGAQVPQPPPGLVDRFGQVAAQLAGQPGDQDRVLVVGLVRWSGPRSCAPTPRPPVARTRTTSRAGRRAGPAPATGARSAHTPPSPRRTRPSRPARRPSPARLRGPTP